MARRRAEPQDAPFLDVSPSTLVFRVGGETSKLAVQVAMFNSHQSASAAFKFKTNAAQRYTVKPVTGLIAPGGSVTVNVRLDPAHVAGADVRDRFLVQSFLVPDSMVGSYTAESWRDVDKSQIKPQYISTHVQTQTTGSSLAVADADAQSTATPGSSPGKPPRLVLGSAAATSSSTSMVTPVLHSPPVSGESVASSLSTMFSSLSSIAVQTSAKLTSAVSPTVPQPARGAEASISSLQAEAAALRSQLAALESSVAHTAGGSWLWLPNKAQLVALSALSLLAGVLVALLTRP